jgi:SAM-dependent methyltransferase
LKDSPSLERWKRAQAAELEWWKNWRKLPFYRNHSFPVFWKDTVHALLGEEVDAFRGVIVEVGCGPHGIVRYLFDNARIKIGIDPLICEFADRPGPRAQTTYAAAIGEKISVRDAASDLVFCINVLDHVMDPNQILQEIRRILKPGGKLVLEVHTFPAVLLPLLIFDRPHTFHWSEREVRRLVKDAGFSILKTRSVPFPIDLPWQTLFHPGHWKYAFGKLFMRLSYFDCQK